MTFSQDGLDHPRVWLRDVVQFTLDEFVRDRANLNRGTTAMTVVYQYHERLFYYLARTGKAPAGSLEGFRAQLGRASPCFTLVAQAAAGQVRPILTFSNAQHGGTALDILGAGAKVQHAVIIAAPQRQLIPLLENVVAAYRRILDEHGL